MKPQISIGIPAYNEERNIARLIEAIRNQKLENIEILEIFVVADGCTDSTVPMVESIIDSRLKITVFTKREGLTVAQNHIMQNASGDIVVLLDADILPKDDLFLEHISRPLLNNSHISLVGAAIENASPRTQFERIMSVGQKFKNNLYPRIHNASNIYMCHGRARALRKNIYSQIKWPNICSEDAYSYLYCISNNFAFAYAPRAVAIFRAPDNIHDHMLQSKRYFTGKNVLKKFFPPALIRRAYRIPPRLFITALLQTIIRHPLRMTGYVGIVAGIKILSFWRPINPTAMIVPSLSSKKI